MKYYVRKQWIVSSKLTLTYYKQYKCTGGWNKDPAKCWKFTKQGACGIIENLNRECKINVRAGILKFDMIPAEEE